ncbi:hypothetical protein [Roseateles sp. PN1]
MDDTYKPQDALSLWWLGQGSKSPTLIGHIFLAEGSAITNQQLGLK